MHRIGIITDSTVQFPRQTTIPRNLALVPLDARLQGMAPSEDINSDTRRVVNLPSYATDTVFPQVSPPTVERITTVMAHQAEYCDSILGIFLSSKINVCYDNAVQAANNLRGRVEIEVIDSLTFGSGSWLSGEAALTAVTSGARFDQVEQSVRGLVPKSTESSALQRHPTFFIIILIDGARL
jgi:fatty acid-binding protein DegV